MSSPFPGMNPFIESQEWPDFHATFMTLIRELLTPVVRPQYIARVERRVYVELPPERTEQVLADVAIVHRGDDTSARSQSSGGVATADEIAPVECLLPVPEEHRESYLVIRHRESQEIVTLIELLSPTNKRIGSRGRALYLEKREELLQSKTSLIEIDVLRGGERVPMLDPLPAGDYFALVCRAWRSTASVYAWSMRQRMPTIKVPLLREDPEIDLNLQTAFDLTFQRAAYEDSLDYRLPLQPPASDSEAEWLSSLVSN